MNFNFIHIAKNGGTSIRQAVKNIRSIKYNGHNVSCHQRINTICVIRNPYDRWISAVEYSKRQFLKQGLRFDYCPSEVAESIIDERFNIDKKFKRFLINDIGQMIGDTRVEYRWIYQTQNTWIYKPKVVLTLDSLKDEFFYFLNNYNIKNVYLNSLNSSKKNNIKLTEKAKYYIETKYKDDFLIFDNYTKLDISKRVDLNN